MWFFPRKLQFPGIKQQPDGSIEFTLTDEEAGAADSALKAFADVLVHPEVADRVRNGTIAVALSRYARQLVLEHCTGIAESDYKSKWPVIRATLEKAVAAEWKSYSLCALPIFLYHRACFLQMLNVIDESKKLFVEFLKKHSEFSAAGVDQALLDYEDTNIENALAHAAKEVATNTTALVAH
jgi:hypothetical protein